jgi:hypothetical protein
MMEVQRREDGTRWPREPELGGHGAHGGGAGLRALTLRRNTARLCQNEGEVHCEAVGAWNLIEMKWWR